MSNNMIKERITAKEEEKPKLKPCPFCGKNNLEYLKLWNDTYQVVCRQCNASRCMTGLNKQMAADFWNWRAIETEMLETLELAYEVINYAGDFINAYDMCDSEMEDFANPKIDKIVAAIKKAKGEK